MLWTEQNSGDIMLDIMLSKKKPAQESEVRFPLRKKVEAALPKDLAEELRQFEISQIEATHGAKLTVTNIVHAALRLWLSQQKRQDRN